MSRRQRRRRAPSSSVPLTRWVRRFVDRDAFTGKPKGTWHLVTPEGWTVARLSHNGESAWVFSANAFGGGGWQLTRRLGMLAVERRFLALARSEAYRRTKLWGDLVRAWAFALAVLCLFLTIDRACRFFFALGLTFCDCRSRS